MKGGSGRAIASARRSEARLHGASGFPILAECIAKGAEINSDDVTFYVGAETIVAAEDGKGLPRWQEALFAAMGRNAARMSDYLQLPYDKVVEIGREIEI